MAVHALGATARFAIPAARPASLPRTALVEKLHAAVGSGVSILQAPAGYGKTSLAAAFLRDVDYEGRWLTLDATSTAPEALAEQLVTSILREQAWRPAASDVPGALAAYLGAALREFEESSRRPLMLVIDNLHELAESEAALELLAWMIESLPIGSELVLTMRRPVALPALDSRIAGGDVLVIGPSELAFTPAEVEELVAARGTSLSAREVIAATGGWPIAVAGVLNGTLSPSGAAGAVAAGTWDRYLGAEIAASVPAGLMEVLQHAALPPIAERELVARLVGETRLNALVEWLRANAFFCDWSDDGDVRFNPIVQRYLRERFRESDPAGFRTAVGDLATVYEAGGRVGDALEFAASTGEFDIAATLLKAHAVPLLQRGAFRIMQRGIDALPPAMLETDRLLQALRARVLAHIGNPAEALALADRSERSPGEGGIEAAHHARLARGRALRLLGRMNEVSRCFDVPLDDLPADPLLLAEHAWHKAHAALGVDSEFEEAYRLLLECLDVSTEAGSPYFRLLCQSAIGQVLVARGDGPASVNMLTLAARGWRELHGGAHLAWVLNNLGMAHMMVGDNESALACLAEAREESRSARDRRSEAFTTASLGDAYLAAGEFGYARSHYEQAIAACVEETLDESLAALATAGLASALLGLGDIDRADFAIRRAIEVAERLGSPYELAMCQVQQAAILSAAEAHAEAVALAERAVHGFEEIGARGAFRAALYRLALIHFRDGNRDAAEVTMGRLATEVSEPWMARCLLPLVQEHPLFAQWADSRPSVTPVLHRVLRDGALETPAVVVPPALPENPAPRVVARSLGALRVMVDGRDVTDDEWESARAKEMFFLLLAHPDGIRKEEAVAHLYPELAPSRCNSQFHSNLYRVRKALYKDSVVKRDGAYMLNPEHEFSWDVREYESKLEQAMRLDPGSPERAAAYESALQLYRGPFAEAFFSEWAASLRDALARKNVEALATLAGYYAGRAEFESAAQCMEQVLKVSRYNDEAAYLLAVYRMRAGQPAAALAFIDSYGAELHRDLSVDLPARMQRLRTTIAAGAV